MHPADGACVERVWPSGALLEVGTVCAGTGLLVQGRRRGSGQHLAPILYLDWATVPRCT